MEDMVTNIEGGVEYKEAKRQHMQRLEEVILSTLFMQTFILKMPSTEHTMNKQYTVHHRSCTVP